MPRKDSDSYWFKFFPDKYLGGTGGFTLEMHGAYMLMLIHQWGSGPFEEFTARAKIGDVWDKIAFKFVLTDHGFANTKMTEESVHKQKMSTIRRGAVQERYKRGTYVPNNGTNVVQTVSVSDSVSCIALAPASVLPLGGTGGEGPIPDDGKAAMAQVLGEGGDPFDPDGTFAKVYAAYPNKAGKHNAKIAWTHVANKAATAALCVEAIAWQEKQPGWTQKNGKYIPTLLKWIEGRRWEDPKPVPRLTALDRLERDGHL